MVYDWLHPSYGSMSWENHKLYFLNSKCAQQHRKIVCLAINCSLKRNDRTKGMIMLLSKQQGKMTPRETVYLPDLLTGRENDQLFKPNISDLSSTGDNFK